MPSQHITVFFFFFFNDTATTEIYTLSLHDALPISPASRTAICGGCTHRPRSSCRNGRRRQRAPPKHPTRDRKSTRLNSSHGYISYAVFCLKKKKKQGNKQLRIETTAPHTRPSDVLR